MRLSEAIRLGATMKRQALSQMSADGSCALKAAQEASGCANSILPIYSKLRLTFPILDVKPISCPRCGDPQFRDRELITIIWHLNDRHRLSREEIAQWVELHEPLPVDQLSDVSVNQSGHDGSEIEHETH